MSRIVSMTMTPRRMRQRARLVPILSTMAGSFVATFPVVAVWPLMPPVGLLMLLGWRLLRPELWPAWMALPLGLWDDLATGQPIGTAPLIWTPILIAIDAADRWIVWRSHLQDWMIAAVALAFALMAAFGLALATGGGGTIIGIMPQLAASILLFPLAQRLCAVLDRWRLLG
ncbi:rod shape-determining protein MreD [Sphingomonas jejuensis]|uniref:Rod shape-determining protein MreD n=1 Tax=Sphingomonas jejuensis TaxID=904715 RepID=A0ABX0XKB7_9SPHN|nr:rod shape-determining protein MreD [Sphingomonas jejuensis]NJC33227.1 rod shape-determining protein MreD [Sphingomonas jejuensis]